MLKDETLPRGNRARTRETSPAVVGSALCCSVFSTKVLPPPPPVFPTGPRTSGVIWPACLRPRRHPEDWLDGCPCVDLTYAGERLPRSIAKRLAAPPPVLSPILNLPLQQSVHPRPCMTPAFRYNYPILLPLTALMVPPRLWQVKRTLPWTARAMHGTPLSTRLHRLPCWREPSIAFSLDGL